MNRTQQYVNPNEDTRRYSVAELVALGAKAAPTPPVTTLTVADIAAAFGIDVVRARCRQLIAQGHLEAANAIRAELPTTRPTERRPHRNNRLAQRFPAAEAPSSRHVGLW